jgi:hypothetical protein
MRTELLREPDPLHPQLWIGVNPQEQVVAVHKASGLRNDVEELIDINLQAIPHQHRSRHSSGERSSHRLVAARQPPLRTLLQPLHSLLGVSRLLDERGRETQNCGSIDRQARQEPQQCLAVTTWLAATAFGCEHACCAVGRCLHGGGLTCSGSRITGL